VDALPGGADEVFRRAEADDAELLVPNIVAAETLYTVRKHDKVKGVSLSADAVDVAESLGTDVPVTVVDDRYEGTRRLVEYIDELSLHDAMVVVSHETYGTDAVLTKDPEIAEQASRAVWE